MTKIVIRTDDVAGFFSRAKDAARRADRGERAAVIPTGYESERAAAAWVERSDTHLPVREEIFVCWREGKSPRETGSYDSTRWVSLRSTHPTAHG